MTNTNAIGIFDSGIGGLTVANAIFDLLPNEQLIYFGDTANIPYGTKSQSLIERLSIAISRFLIEEKKCKAIVLACNTASAAALTSIRSMWPSFPFVGMEPAVKPAVKATQNGKIGVLATAGTFGSERYASLVKRYAEDVEVFEDPCLGLVQLIESGKQDAIETRMLLEGVLHPMLQKRVDTFVLGCTHYPFITPLLGSILGKESTIINPAPAVARQLKKVLQQNNLERENPFLGKQQFYISAYNEAFDAMLKQHCKMPYVLSPLEEGLPLV